MRVFLINFRLLAGADRRRFFHVELAFDRVWNPGLLYKDTEIHFPDCYIHLIASFLQNRTFRVRVDNTCLLYTSRCV